MKRSKKSLTFGVLSTLFICLLIYHIFNYAGPLERVKLGNIDVRPGNTLLEVSEKINMSLKKSGEPWRVKVESEVSDRRATENFGGGGNAIIVATVARRFGCKYKVIEADKCIFMPQSRSEWVTVSNR